MRPPTHAAKTTNQPTKGRTIVESRPTHPTKEIHWFPVYNSTEGVRALDFIKDQIAAGIKPQQKLFDTAFAQNKSFVIMLGGSWMPGGFPRNQWPDIEQKLGFIPMFPVPTPGDETATTMSGWLLSIPDSSANKDLSWELITIVMEPRILAPWLERYGYLPTQIQIGQKIMRADNLMSFPYYKKMISMIPFGHSRPNIPEYPEIANHIKQALDDAATKSARLLGW
jgi:multiple sugar transport system substrate-binding protein